MIDTRQTTPLAELCEVFTDGNWVESKDQSPSGARLIQTGNVGKGIFKNRMAKARFVSEETFREMKCTEVFPGDCLISRLPDPVGRCCIVPDLGERMITAVDCSILRLKGSQVLPTYFNYYAQSADYFNEVESYCTGATRKRISRKNLGKVRITLPSIEEQKRIVAILDEAFAGIETAIANTEKNLANARELYESSLANVFGQRGEWQIATLDRLCHIARGGSPRPIKAFLTQGPGGVNWIKISDATASSKYIYETKQKIKPEGIKRSRMVKEGDFLLSNSMSFGRPYIMRTSGCVHDGWLVLRDKAGLYDQDYLYYFLSSPEAFRQFDARAAGSTVRNLNIDLVRSIEIPLPPLEQQKRLAKSIEELFDERQQLGRIHARKLEALDELKQSLLRKAFTGELTADRAEREVDSATA